MRHNVKHPDLKPGILIFKTSIQTQLEVKFLASILDLENGISSWSVDLDDWEKILRIESNGITPDKVESILSSLNIQFKQL